MILDDHDLKTIGQRERGRRRRCDGGLGESAGCRENERDNEGSGKAVCGHHDLYYENTERARSV
jgi:hypothetical protein